MRDQNSIFRTEGPWNETNINIVYRFYLTQCIFYGSLVPRDHFGDVEIAHVQISIHRGSLWIGLIATVQVRIGLYTRGLNRCIHIRGWLSIMILLFLAITLACKWCLVITTTIWWTTWIENHKCCKPWNRCRVSSFKMQVNNYYTRSIVYYCWGYMILQVPVLWTVPFLLGLMHAIWLDDLINIIRLKILCSHLPLV